ncbi:TnsA-like heteromeric transposase endonuclease subunit [Marisediminicola sp. LYQ134]|uniref:TnsA-like heteromeric transposase endonuclease subunit n=1 Tax=Marisediminicola sp. LYQ134 TaxID=3391061 RepID=UPI00398375ED
MKTKPTSNTDIAASITWLVDGEAQTVIRANSALLERELYRAEPIRVGNRYPGQRNYHGTTHFSNTAQQIWHESLMERTFLLHLDFHEDVVAVAAQPMEMRFSDGTRHIPDYLALHSDHRQVLYNVKPKKHITEKYERQFDNATAICEQVGWTHEVVSDFDPNLEKNVAWLSNFRHHLNRPALPAWSQLMDCLDDEPTIAAAAETMTLAPTHSARAAIYHLTWTGELELDLHTPITDRTIVRKAH